MDQKATTILEIINERRIAFLRQIADVIPLDSSEISMILGNLELTVTNKSSQKISSIDTAPIDHNKCHGIKKNGERCSRSSLPNEKYCKSHLPKDDSSSEPETHDIVGISSCEDTKSNTICKVSLPKNFSPNIDFLPRKKNNLTMIRFKGSYYYYDTASTTLFYYKNNRYHYFGYMDHNKIVSN